MKGNQKKRKGKWKENEIAKRGKGMQRKINEKVNRKEKEKSGEGRIDGESI